MNKRNVITYSLGKNWDYLFNFNIPSLSIQDNIQYAKLLFELLPKSSELIGSIEHGKNQSFHIHFLLKSEINKNDLFLILDKMIGYENGEKGKHFHLSKFDEKRRYGVLYQLKGGIQYIKLKK